MLEKSCHDWGPKLHYSKRKMHFPGFSKAFSSSGNPSFLKNADSN